MISPLLGFLAACFSILLTWPQVWMSCVRGRTSGLSATACWLAAALNVGWVTYGLIIGDGVQVATNGVCGVANTAVLVSLLAQQPTLRTPGAVLATSGGALALLAAAATAAVAAGLPQVGPEVAGGAFGGVLAAVGIAACLTQPVSLLRDRAQDLSGLSMTRWRLTVVASSSWLGYGLLTGQPAVWASSVVGLLAALTVCTLLAQAERSPAAVVLEPASRLATAPLLRVPTPRRAPQAVAATVPLPRVDVDMLAWRAAHA